MAMRFTMIALIAALSFQPALAVTPHKHRPAHAASESQLVEHGDYTNADDVQVHRPAHSKNGRVPEGATAQCRDRSYSFSLHHRGTCSRHGGVAQWLN